MSRTPHSIRSRNRTRLVPPAPAAPVEVLGRALDATDRMTLRPLAVADREAFIDAVRRSRTDLDRWLPIHEPGESDDALFDRQLALTREGEATGRARRRIGALHDGSIAGAWNLTRIERGLHWEADCNWWVRSDLAGQGLAREGAVAILRHALADLPHGLGLHQIVGAVAPDHLASKRVLERLGFTPRRGVRISSTIGGRISNDELWVATRDSVARAAG